jgi:O-antigen ligase
MARARSAAAVLPALLPGLLVAVLGFQAGGFFPDAWAPVALVLAVALALRLATVERPFAGISGWTGAALAALAVLGVWVLLSASWSDAPGRAMIEFVRLLLYGLVLALCASAAAREGRLAWAVRGVAVAIGAVCIAGLITRLRPDVWSETGLNAGRLDFPITYWNGMGFVAGIGVLLALHLAASSREPWWVRVPAAGLVPIAACTVYFTLSRGGIAAGVAGLVVYLLVGSSRATPGALVAIVPPTAVALSKAYGAELLISSDYADAAGRAEGREMVTTLVLCVAAAIVLRAAALLIDRLMALAPSPARLPMAVRAGAVAAVATIVLITAVAAGAPAYAERQVDRFVDSGTALPDTRDRLTDVSSSGRADNWDVALAAWRTERLHGTGAGTYQNEWNTRREIDLQVIDAHSLYLETLSDLGVVGLVLLAVALGSLLLGLVWRLGSDDRPTIAAVLAAMTAWAIHAGADWDWELTAVSVWMFGLAGLALARRAPLAGGGPPRLLRLIAALGCLILALVPGALWRSQEHLQTAAAAFERGDCPATVDAALNSLGALGARPEPWELIAYCDVRLGQPKLAEGAARAAIARDPANWEYHYALALVRGAAGEDPRAAAAAARRLNPREPLTTRAVRAFDTDRPALWERRARRLPLYLR